MKLDKKDIMFLETYDMDEFHFEMGISNYFKDKYGIECNLNRGESYLGIIDYSFFIYTFTINFDAKKYYDEDNNCRIKIDVSQLEVYDRLKDEVININDLEDEDKKKEIINNIINEISEINNSKDNESKGIYFNYDSVIELLEQAKNEMINSMRCPRPKDIPKDIIWCESMGDEEFDPYVYKGDMSVEDFKKAQQLYFNNEEKEN